jgi:hypothetical protein
VSTPRDQTNQEADLRARFAFDRLWIEHDKKRGRTLIAATRADKRAERAISDLAMRDAKMNLVLLACYQLDAELTSAGAPRFATA